MIRLIGASGGTYFKSPNFTWPANTGSSFTEVTINHNLGTLQYSVDVIRATKDAAPGYYLEGKLDRGTSGDTWSYAEFHNTNNVVLRLFKPDQGAAPYFAMIKTFE